jgi:hypothetical protein
MPHTHLERAAGPQGDGTTWKAKHTGEDRRMNELSARIEIRDALSTFACSYRDISGTEALLLEPPQSGYRDNKIKEIDVP